MFLEDAWFGITPPLTQESINVDSIIYPQNNLVNNFFIDRRLNKSPLSGRHRLSCFRTSISPIFVGIRATLLSQKQLTR
jgi:hypothetical protein